MASAVVVNDIEEPGGSSRLAVEVLYASVGSSCQETGRSHKQQAVMMIQLQLQD